MSRDLLALVVAVTAAVGVHLAYSGAVLGQRSLTPIPIAGTGHTVDRWLQRAGLADIRLRDVVGISVIVGIAVALGVFTIFGAPAPATATGLFAASFPFAGARYRRAQERSVAADAWPRLLEELRLRTTSLGRSIPTGLLEIGDTAPDSMKGAFASAQREWLISTDFERTLDVLKAELAEPTADVVCETLLVAHRVGGADLDGRLAALIEDRIADTQARKDARAKQAGARFARRFVLAVPFGMALAGMSVGNGRSAFRSPTGQLLTVIAVGLVVACWLWSGSILRVPEEERVFGPDGQEPDPRSAGVSGRRA